MLSGTQGLLSPSFLWLFLPLALLITLVARGLARKTAMTHRLTGERPSTGGLVVISLIPLFLIVAVSRPYWGLDSAEVSETEDELMFVVDVSRSMLAKDVPPSRITLAKRKMRDIIDLALAQGVPLRYGITIFAGGSYVLCPATSDTAVVKQFIDEISPEMVSSLGSHVALGLKTALGRYTQADATRTQDTAHIRLLLISDGEDEPQAEQEAVELAKAGGIRIDVLGLGTTEGSQLPLENGQFVQDSSGALVHSRLSERSLRTIAESSGGTYLRATLTDADIEKLIKRTAIAVPNQASAKRTIITYRELGPFLALLALVILMAILVRRRELLLSLLVAATALGTTANQVSAQTPAPAPDTSLLSTSGAEAARQGYELYQQGDFKGAEEAFRKALAGDPNNSRVLQSYASALFKNGKAQEAAKVFHDIAQRSEIGKEYFENTYNEGNALLKLGRFQDAIDAFGKALDVKPDDEQTLHNLRVARALLQEQKNRPTPSPSPQSSEPQQSSQTPQPSPSPEQQQSQERSQGASPSPAPAPASAPSQTPSSDTSEAEPHETRDSSPTPATSPASSESPRAEPSPSVENTATTHKEKQRDQEKEPQSGEPSERQKEAAPEQPEEPTSARSDGSHPTPAPKTPPSFREAEAWLESLPESPLIITKDRATRSQSGQTW